MQQSDITDLHAKEANYDELTGLLNRRAGRPRRRAGTPRQEEASLIVGMFDLDRLKEINDLYGHVEGDRALRTIAQEMQRAARAGCASGQPGDASSSSCSIIPTATPWTGWRGRERLRVRREQLTSLFAEFSFGCFKVMPGCGMTVTEVPQKPTKACMTSKETRPYPRSGTAASREASGWWGYSPEALEYDSLRLYNALVKHRPMSSSPT